MRFTTALVASLSFLGLALAQGNSTNMVIQVGSTADAQGGIFQFIPNNIRAPNGTVVTFRFTGMPGNHSITQSTFTDPCTPRDGGFDSGWVFLPSAGLTPVPEWNLTITNETQPIWFFCKQLLPQPHCAAGMVGAINAPTSGPNTFDAYRQAASRATTSGQNNNGLVGVGASASARPDPIPSGATAFPAISTNTSPSGPSGSGSGSAPSSTPTGGAIALSAGPTVFVAIAGVAGMLLA